MLVLLLVLGLGKMNSVSETLYIFKTIKIEECTFSNLNKKNTSILKFFKGGFMLICVVGLMVVLLCGNNDVQDTW